MRLGLVLVALVGLAVSAQAKPPAAVVAVFDLEDTRSQTRDEPLR